MKNEAVLTDAAKEQMRLALVTEKDEVTDNIYRLQKSLTETAENDPDPMDVASKVEGRNNIMAESNRLTVRLKQINAALSRFNDDEYGVCETCFADIPVRRMQFDPASTQCVDCKQEAEVKGRQFNR